MKKHAKKGLIALKKAHTSLGNVVGLMKDDNDYMDVLQQVHAVQGLLKSATHHFLSEHVQDELLDLGYEKKKQKKALESVVDDIATIIKLAQKK